MKKDGLDASPIEKWDWNKIHEGEWSREDVDAIMVTLEKFFKRHTKAELLKISLETGIHVGVCLNVEEALKFPQFVERGYWQEVEHPELETSLIYPGSFVKFSDADCKIRFRAPLIGEHNQDILGKELGLSRQELVNLKQNHVI
jgi:crotonobetainyl-CoA:carnitine CoA-transferase CaiB-like acyl-CoA transferase